MCRIRGPWMLVALFLSLFLVGCTAQSPSPPTNGTPTLLIPPTPGGTPLMPTRVPTADLSSVPNCDSPRTVKFPTGTTRFASIEEAEAALGSDMLFWDKKDLPAGATLLEAYYSTAMTPGSNFKSSTMGLTYTLGDQTKGPNILALQYWNHIQPFGTPKEPHDTTTVQGGKTAYLFDAPERATMHTINWDQGCRLVTIVGDLPKADIAKLAEALRPGRNDLATVRPAATP